MADGVGKWEKYLEIELPEDLKATVFDFMGEDSAKRRSMMKSLLNIYEITDSVTLGRYKDAAQIVIRQSDRDGKRQRGLSATAPTIDTAILVMHLKLFIVMDGDLFGAPKGLVSQKNSFT